MGKLSVAKCNCGQILIPPKDRCVLCSGETEPVHIPDKGRILTYTILHTTPAGFDSPLILGLIELDGLRNKENTKSPKLVCIGDINEKDLKIGIQVRVEQIENKYYFKKDN
jgi:uncharacterized OB-fold protein